MGWRARGVQMWDEFGMEVSMGKNSSLGVFLFPNSNRNIMSWVGQYHCGANRVGLIVN